MKTIHEVEEAGTTAGPTGPLAERRHEKSREELEAEMTLLREQLRSAHASMRRTHAQMEVQKKRTKQLVAAWKVRLEEGEEKSRRQKEILDQQMQKVVADLMFFEGALRKEQRDIKLSMEEKDEMISSQKRTIDSLLAANVALTKGIKKLKRKLKESVRTSPDVTSEGHTNWSIQQEADALISQIFSNRNNNYNKSSSGELVNEPLPEEMEEIPMKTAEAEFISSQGVEDCTNTGDENVLNRVPKADPHVFFCLTERKGENSNSLNFKTTTASYPIMCEDGNVELDNPALPQSDNGERAFKSQTNHSETNGEKDDMFRNNDARTNTGQKTLMFEMSPSKSCPNLGLASIAEETNFVAERGRTRSESEEYLLDYDVIYDVDDVDSDVFSASHNSCSSASALECSFTSSMGGVDDHVYENLPADNNSLLKRQIAFDQPSIEIHDSGSGVPDVDNEGNADLEVEPPGDSKWKQIRSPPRTSSFNLLRRIRRPRDLKKKKAARTNSDSGDTTKDPPLERQRKLTI